MVWIEALLSAIRKIQSDRSRQITDLTQQSSASTMISKYHSLFLLPFTLIWAACKTRDRKSLQQPDTNTAAIRNNTAKKEENGTAPTPYSSSGETATKSNEEEKKSVCSPQSINKIDWQGLPDAGENLEAVYKFYGDHNSAMVVVSLPKYQHGNLSEMYLLRPSGKLLAGKGIVDQTDIRPDTSIRPVVFDNLRIKSDRQLILVFKTACPNCEGSYFYSKHTMKYAIAFSDTFLGKKVQSPTPLSVPGVFGEYQAFANIGPNPEFTDRFFKSGSYSIASEDAVFSAATELKDCIITDLSGTPVSGAGDTFTDILEYPEFICYRLVDDQFYLRTFVRLL
ncbi:MAG: hypothetical protein H6618_08245 [Deltaproteobacteria bacterium]|nr:hypothetical protein [Deltaproteobacteria bacterium]